MRMPVQKRSSMQNGSLIRANRRNGQEVWEFRWRDRTSGKAVYRRIVLGSAQQFPTEIEARAAAADRINFTRWASPQNNLGAARFELVRRRGKWDKQH
jgi:hypothetical protein